MENCRNFVLKGDGISPGNFGDLRNAAISLNIPEMEQKVKQFIWKNFLQIRYSAPFRSLPLDYLRQILSSPKLAVNRESNVLGVITRWLRDEPQRRSELLKLLQCVRLRQLDNRELVEMSKDRRGIFREDRRCLDGVQETLTKRLLYQDGDLELRATRESDWPRDSTAGLLMVAGGKTDVPAGEIPGVPKNHE